MGLFYAAAEAPAQGGFLYCANGVRGLKVYEAVVSGDGNTLAGFTLVGAFLPPAGELPPWPILQDYSLNVFVQDHLA